MWTPEYSYGTIHLAKPPNYNRFSLFNIRKRISSIFNFGSKGGPTPLLTFDTNPYIQPLETIADDKSITFSSYIVNDMFPFTIYRLPLKSIHKEYYNFVGDDTAIEKIGEMLKSYPNRSTVDMNMNASPYNCLYSDILRPDRTHLCVMKFKHREAFLFVYNSRELSEAQVSTMLKRIFLGESISTQ